VRVDDVDLCDDTRVTNATPECAKLSRLLTLLVAPVVAIGAHALLAPAPAAAATPPVLAIRFGPDGPPLRALRKAPLGCTG